MKLPHSDTYTRLRPSKRHGIGVFAIRPIKKGALVFGLDDDDTVKVPKRRILHLPTRLKRLYHDFCVLRGDVYECPLSFNKLTPSWFLNDSRNDKPNVAPDSELKFRALRDIRPGEELLARYDDYSENDLS
jgi:SET domain-containing protein